MPASKVQLIGGDFQDSEGNVLDLGYLEMTLNQDENVTGVGQIVSGITIRIQLNSSGAVDEGTPQEVWGNDQMSPVNSFYRVKGFTAAGQLAWGPNNQQVIGDGGTFDVGTWIPNIVLSWFPPLQVPLLQTNEVDNPDQGKLDLHAGANVTIVDNGAGRVTIAATGALTPVTFETNGTTNGSQAILNLKDGTNITVTDDGVGGITFDGTPTPAYQIHRFYGAESECPINAASTVMGTTGTVYFLLIELENPILVSKVTACLNTVDGIGRLGFAAGIYDLAGAKILSGDGLSTGAIGPDSISITPTQLAAGQYYFAWGAFWTSINPAQSGGHDFTKVSSSGLSTLNAILNFNNVAYGTAANALVGSTAGAIMPATLGALTKDSVSTNIVVPMVLFEA